LSLLGWIVGSLFLCIHIWSRGRVATTIDSGQRITHTDYVNSRLSTKGGIIVVSRLIKINAA